MEKRFFIALALSFLLISVYSGMQKKLHPIENKVVVGNSEVEGKGIPMLGSSNSASSVISSPSSPSSSSSPASSTFTSRMFSDENEDTATYETDKLFVTISKIGGYIKSIELKDPPSLMSFRGLGAVRGWEDAPFEMLRKDNGFLLAYQPGTGEEVLKEFYFTSPLTLTLTTTFKAATDLKPTNYEILVGAVSSKNPKDPVAPRYLELAYYAKIVSRRPLVSIHNAFSVDDKPGWLGLRDKYFVDIVAPEQTALDGVKVEADGDYRLVWSAPESLKNSSVRFYVGPQDEDALRAFKEGSNQIVSYGKFDLIAKPIALLLEVIQRVTKNWGVAILLMTIIVYVVLSPLSVKSMRSMRRMQVLQPQVEALKVKFKDNPQKLNIEVMELYKREKVNPLGGCLPMMLQIPVFFSLYQVLMRSIELKGQGFLWIKDLSEPDRLFIFSKSLPVIGNELNILPILMAGLMVLQQKITMKTSAAASPEMAQQQKIMSTVMPVVFGVLFYRIQSGLVLYWFTNSLLSVVFQWKINKSLSVSK